MRRDQSNLLKESCYFDNSATYELTKERGKKAHLNILPEASCLKNYSDLVTERLKKGLCVIGITWIN